MESVIGTAVVAIVVVLLVALAVRSMIKDKKIVIYQIVERLFFIFSFSPLPLQSAIFLLMTVPVPTSSITRYEAKAEIVWYKPYSVSPKPFSKKEDIAREHIILRKV